MADKYIALKTELDTIAQGLIQKSGSSTTTLTFPDEFTATIAQLVKPTGSIGITSTTPVDVSTTATAYIDSANVENLEAANIITGKTILGVAGSAVVPSGSTTIISVGDTDVTNYATANIPTSDVPADKICTGTSILGVAGTFEGIIPSGSLGITSTSATDVRTISTAYIDAANVTNLTPTNIVKDVVILGVTGTYTPNLQTKTATVNGEVTADSEHDGLEKVIVSIPTYTWEW